MDQQRKNGIPPIRLFISFDSNPTDKVLCEELIKHLGTLRYQGQIDIWHPGRILPGTNSAEAKNHSLENASIILLLISPDFMNSEHCRLEMERAFQLRSISRVHVIPILLRSVDLNGTPLAHLECLPRQGKPVKECSRQNRDAQWKAIVEEIRESIKALSSSLAGTSVSPSSPVWNVPYLPNPFFTGRDEILERLHRQLQGGQPVALSQAQAICGLGGVGKTRIAVEYAYQWYRQEYQTVLWARAESQEALISSYVDLASLLNLPAQDALNQMLAVQAVKRWLENHQQWLLILDNADTPELLSEFLPASPGGHILLTTRAQAIGHLARRFEIEALPLEWGALLLLRRAGLLSCDATIAEASVTTEWEAALEISHQLGGLPLALDEAGAYLEATRMNISRYPQLFQQCREKLLKERRGLLKDHPDSVATTLLLSFDRVEQKSRAAADLLRLCAYLAPDTIAEEIIIQGAPYLGSQLEPMAANVYGLNQAIEELRNYSLISRDSKTNMLSIHRLVQAVLQDALSDEKRRLWKERAVYAVNTSFPGLEPSHWAACERWLPHAFLCAHWIEQEQMIFPVASRLLAQAGLYLKERAQYTQAEPLLQQALTIDKQVYGPEHLNVAADLNNLGCLYWNQGKYRETEPLFQQALIIRQQHLGYEHPETVETLQNLACLYQSQGKHEEAKQMFQSASMVDEHRADATFAIDLSNQADLSRRLGHYEEAESLLERALDMYEHHIGQDHLTIAYLLHKQGLLAYEQGKLEEAESFFRRTLAIYEHWLGDEHPNTAQILNALGELARIQRCYEEAEMLFERALASKEKQFGEMHSSTAASLNGLALLYLEQGKYVYVKQGKYMEEGKFEEAESLFQRALEIRRHTLGDKHPDTALLQSNLGCLYQAQGENEKAGQCFRDALTVYEEQLGREHPSTIQTLHNFIYCCGIQGKYEEAQPLLEQGLTAHQQTAGHKYPKMQLLRRDMAPLLEALGWDKESTN